MAKIILEPDQQAAIEKALSELEEYDDQIDALMEIGGLHPGLKAAHEQQKARARLLLEKFTL